MGNILGGGGNSFGLQGSSQCCDPKVDPISVLVAIGAIAAASVFLRQAVIDNNVMGPGRKRRSFWWQQGKRSTVENVTN